jgi:isopentenyldiphosphate isomerase
VVAQQEMVEWIDDAGRVIEVVPRARMRADNLLHRSVAVIVTTTDGRLVVQRRSGDKDLFPGWWDIGAGGVITAGESPGHAARRELHEELGIDTVPEFVTTGRHDDEHARELCHIYRVVHDGPCRPVDGEVVEVRTVDPEGFRRLTATAPFLPGSLALLLAHVPGFAAATVSQATCAAPEPARLRWEAVQRVEFTIEPFVEAEPGAHVTAPAEALRGLGIEVEVGPFGSGCTVPDRHIGDVVATITRIAVEHGATHINIDVEAVDES